MHDTGSAHPSDEVPLVHVVDPTATAAATFERACVALGLQTRTHTDTGSFLEQFDPSRPGCVAVRLSGTPHGADLLGEISRRGWNVPVLLLGEDGALATALPAFTLGDGPGDIEENDDPLSSSLHAAIDFDRRRRAAEGLRQQIAARVARLTPRERQVMELVVEGKPNRIIAADLGVSPKTVEVHRANVMQKMQADSLASLVKMAIAYGGAAGASPARAVSNGVSA